MVQTANLCLEANNKNEVIHSKDVAVKDVDAITLLRKVNHQMSFKRKVKLKNTLSEDYKAICEQDHSDFKQLLGDDLVDNAKAKATHSMNQSISNKSWDYLLVLLGIQYPFTQATQRLAPAASIL